MELDFLRGFIDVARNFGFSSYTGGQNLAYRILNPPPVQTPVQVSRSLPVEVDQELVQLLNEEMKQTDIRINDSKAKIEKLTDVIVQIESAAGSKIGEVQVAIMQMTTVLEQLKSSISTLDQNFVLLNKKVLDLTETMEYVTEKLGDQDELDNIVSEAEKEANPLAGSF